MKKAVQIYQHAIELCENDENQVSQRVYCLQQLTQIYAEIGRHRDAIPLYKELINLGGAILGTQDPEIIDAGLNLARAYEMTEQFGLADEEYRIAISKAEKVYGLSHHLSQEIRQEYFDAIANREVVARDKLTHGLTLERASQNNPNVPITGERPITGEPIVGSESVISGEPATGNESPSRASNTRPVKKYLNLSQSTKIKRLRYSEQVEEQPGDLLKPSSLRRHWRDIFYVVSVALCIGAIFIAFSKLFVPNELPDSNLIAQRLIGGVFRSVDGANGIQFLDNKYAVLLNDVHHRKIPYFLLKGGMRDLKEMILGMLARKEYWYQLNQDELTTENGNIYYSGDAPEISLTRKMQSLADFAKRYYAQNGCYPDKAEKLKDEPGLAYINPFENKAEMPVVRRLSAGYARDAIFPGVKTEATPSECYWFLRQGGTWRDDLVNSPGKISALSLFTSQRCADGYKVTEFYIHGFDRHGNLITAGKPETFYAIGLNSGQNLNDDNREVVAETERASVHPPERIYITPGYVVDVRFWRQFLSTMLGGSVVLSLIAWFFLEYKKRKANPKQPLQPMEIVFLICFSIWAYVTLIHLIP